MNVENYIFIDHRLLILDHHKRKDMIIVYIFLRHSYSICQVQNKLYSVSDDSWTNNKTRTIFYMQKNALKALKITKKEEAYHCMAVSEGVGQYF